MTKTLGGWDPNEANYQPSAGKELKDDSTVLDVPEWREGQATKLDTQTEKLTQGNIDTRHLLFDILKELKKMNTQLSIITGEEV